MSEQHEPVDLTSEGGPPQLRADCKNCFALCCVAPTFSVSADFPITKQAGQPCSHLQPDFRCGIHTGLRQQGFRGCTVYDCFGAGQKVSQITFSGLDWRRDSRTAKQMFEVFHIMRNLHELLWYLTEALTLPSAHSLYDELNSSLAEIEHQTHNRPDVLMELDVTAHQRHANALLLRASELARARVQQKKDLRGADLIGANLKGADLRGASLRGAYLIGTDLRGADLRLADVIGADFRDADLRGADLTGSIFLIQSQLDAAKGDNATKIPPSLTQPKHW